MPVIQLPYTDEYSKETTWSIDPGMRVIVTNSKEEEILSIEPDDLLAIADAVRGMRKREIEDSKVSV